MSVVCKKLYKTEENKFTPDQILNTCFSIFSGILALSENIHDKPATIFDHIPKSDYHKQGDFDDNLQSQDLDSTSSDSSSEEEYSCNLDKYNIDSFVVLCYKALCFDENLMILSMMIFDKILAKKFVVTEKNIHKIFFLCMMEVQKYYNDVPFTNKDCAELSGLSTKELLDLELEFMNYIDYDMNITEENYIKYKKRMKNFFENKVMIEIKYLGE